MLFLSTTSIAQVGSLGADNFFEGFSLPLFPEGKDEMEKFIYAKLVYPTSESDIQGSVSIKFTVTEKGNLENISIEKSLHPDYDSVAINIVRSMPKWIPGKERRKYVSMDYSLPIFFYGKDIIGKVYTLANPMPEFPGGIDSLLSFIRKNLKYPNTETNFTGKVIIRFIVTKDGKIKNPDIIKSLSPEADNEVLRLVMSMPDWTPAKRNGENVNVYYHLPITFKIKEQ